MDLLVILAFLSDADSSFHIVNIPRLRRKRQFKKRCTISQTPVEEFQQTYRLNEEAFVELYERIKLKIQQTSHRSQAISGKLKLLAVLHFLATGNFQHCIGGRFGFSQSTFSRIIHQVVKAIILETKTYIRFPQSPDEIRIIKEEFYQKAGFPNIVALIDCTHVALIPPSADEMMFRNRKMFHSINVQVCCGPNMEITDVVAKYPGSTHDAFILQNSFLATKFQNGDFGDSILLGDNGYSLKSWLMTPFLNPTSDSQIRYNNAHRKTRGMIERLFGVLKSRFRCLDMTGGALLYKPEFVCQIIVACCILHNIANQHNLPITIADNLREEISHQGDDLTDRGEDGYAVRNEITDAFF